MARKIIDEEEAQQVPSTANGYVLVNPEKVRRAAEGSPTSEGTPTGGVGYEDETALLAQYDRLGGLVRTSEGRKVKTGSFWDFKANKAIAKPAPVLLIKVGDEEVEVPEGEPLPIEAQAAEILADSKKGKAPKKTAKVKGKGKGKGKTAVELPEGQDEAADE